MQIKAPPTVAVFGGSFNPVHNGHLGIVRALAEDSSLLRILVVPTRRSPFKSDSIVLPEDQRWTMLRQAVAGMSRVSVSDIELRRPAPSYTVDTLRTLAALLPASSLTFALGWDAFREFTSWHRASEILALCSLTVFDRAGESVPEDPGLWCNFLPPPWDGKAQVDDLGRLVSREGRLLLRRLSVDLPNVSAREILRERRLDFVPPGAREVLSDYWQRA